MRLKLYRIVLPALAWLLASSISAAAAQPTEPFDYGNFDAPTVID